MAAIMTIVDGIEKQLEGMVKRANLVPGYLNRVVYRQYQNAQRDRWKNNNSGDDFAGEPWAPLDPAYAAWKKKKFSGYPGGGSKTMIRTGRLKDSVIGPSSEHLKIVDSRSIRISTSVEYGRFADQRRTFTQFSDKFYDRLYGDLKDYLVKNIIKVDA